MDRIVSVDGNFDLPLQTRNRIASAHGLRVVDPSFGDGSTDATAAIQSKLNQAGTDGGIVLIPAGTFMKSAPLSIPDGVTIQGVGPGQSTIRNYAGAGTTVLKNANANGGGGITVRDLNLEGLRGGSTTTPYSTLHFTGIAKRSYIHNVNASGGTRLALWPDPNSGRGECIEILFSEHVQLSGIKVENADYDGLKIRGSRYIQATNVWAHNCEKDGIQISGGQVESGTDSYSEYCTVTNAVITHDTGVGRYGNPAITFHDTIYCQFVGLQVYGTGRVAGMAGNNVVPRIADAVLRPRTDSWGTRPAHGSNVVYHPLDESINAVHYDWWYGDNESIMTRT